MRGAYIVAKGDLTLREITPEIIKPEPHTVVSDPNPRRALPRRGAEA